MSIKRVLDALVGRAILATAVIAIIGLAVASCGGSGSSGKYKATFLSPTVQGDTFTIPLTKVQSSVNARFLATTPAGQESFMVYVYKGQTYVRASVCVPCGGRSFTLQGSTLVCDTCGTIFDAATGKGKSGVPACQTYNKAPVAFKVADGNIVMKTADLLSAFQTTLDRKPY